MKQELTSAQQALHERAKELSIRHREIEWQLIETLHKIDSQNLFKQLGHSSLFKYVVDALNFSESVAYSLITVSRKAFEITQLREALSEQGLSVSKASRIVSSLNGENAANLVAFAKTNSSRDIDFEVARINPRSVTRDRAKILTDDQVELKLTVSKEVYRKLERARSLLTTRSGDKFRLADTLKIVLEDYLNRFDPIEKANHKRTSQKLCPVRVWTQKKSHGRKALLAYEKHKVHSRDGGRCTHTDINGKRCTNDRWLHKHHIRPISHGGTNHPDNLASLCFYHHDLVHQLSLAVDGQISWLKEQRVEYRVS